MIYMLVVVVFFIFLFLLLYIQHKKEMRYYDEFSNLLRLRSPMDKSEFVSQYGHALTEQEQGIALEVRYIISMAAKIENDLIYPGDKMLELFGKDHLFSSCAEKLVLSMEERGFIKKYNINLRKIKNPEVSPELTVANFIDSVLACVTT